jgi:hypothetical protein
MTLCLGCGCELATRDVRKVIVHGRPYGPLCAACAAPLLAGMSFADWLNYQWQREHPN